MDSFDSGSSISYSHKLTLDCTDMDYPALLMEMNRTICTIYIDDDLIFDSSAPSNAGTFDAPVFCFAAIPKGVYENSTITINLIAMDSYVYRKSTPVMVGEYNDLFRNIIDVFRFPIMITVFIIMFGGIMLFLCLLYYPFHSELRIVMYSSLYMLLVGIWGLCDYHFATLALDSHMANILQYTSLFISVGVLYLIIDSLLNVKVKYVLKIIGMGLAFIGLASLFLHGARLVNQSEFFMFYIIMHICAIIILLVIDFRQIILEGCSITVALNLITLTVFVVFMDINIVVTTYFTNSELGKNTLLVSMFPLGAAVYVIGQIANYVSFIAQSVARASRNNELTQIAYTDELTQINNRAAYAQKTIELDNSDNNYCIISLDLNNLKQVNDKYGHFAGDRLIRDFGLLLNDVFKEYFCARIGGDEFVVVMEDATLDNVTELITKMSLALAKLDELQPEVKHSAAYGYAFKKECPANERTAHNTFLYADERMYLRKETQHMLLKAKENNL